MFEKSIPALTFIKPRLCSTIRTPLLIDIIFFDSFNTHCINPGCFFNFSESFLASSDTFILSISTYLFSDLDIIF